jgi:YD repeat-containing protein
MLVVPDRSASIATRLAQEAHVRGDRAGDLTRVIQPKDRTEAFARDARGAEVAWTDGTGAKVAIARDALGAAASLADPAGATLAGAEIN